MYTTSMLMCRYVWWPIKKSVKCLSKMGYSYSLNISKYWFLLLSKYRKSRRHSDIFDIFRHFPDIFRQICLKIGFKTFSDVWKHVFIFRVSSVSSLSKMTEDVKWICQNFTASLEISKSLHIMSWNWKSRVTEYYWI